MKVFDSFTPPVSKKQAIRLCNQSIRRMLNSYRHGKNTNYPALIRKRIHLRRWINESGRTEFTREELGLAKPGWLLQQIGAVSALIPKTNRYC
ncbi:hypothetical protein [Endozoicomonas sp. ONNA2]|uniref:hypothetical protein n=1 Tax=Endozoicomonas sp. ONNA2 TaxID=2828741 RepID=UPI002148F526|nr:hypothetical protein [Endozoicomonas sp. ONNA2]